MESKTLSCWSGKAEKTNTKKDSWQRNKENFHRDIWSGRVVELDWSKGVEECGTWLSLSQYSFFFLFLFSFFVFLWGFEELNKQKTGEGKTRETERYLVGN